ncbi:MAG: class I SAM-dependent methyltransferase [Candidatus Sungbacteria bacterium]|uniref:Class I SAM-dependent methyltransferase n=1 Tax=Candidatus Sungiibacteriota bacterium TaxID=2750080 RepID=A0A9D6LR73_9BACT|nr:class I SAM-dependent methyltransferase [Candidatus Sungbacteria bacterium]
MSVQDEITGHFDAIAAEYDYWKKKNWYYYRELESIASREVRPSDRVLDAGCGTGSMLAAVSSAEGVGVDISPQMIQIANVRHGDQKNLSFYATDIVDFSTDRPFEVILFFDVIEHLEKPAEVIKTLSRLVKKNGKLIITMANPAWEPILMLGEKLKLKMKEGPHHRISIGAFRAMLERAGFHITKTETRLLIPKYIPFISNLINKLAARIPIVRDWGVIKVFIASRVA